MFLKSQTKHQMIKNLKIVVPQLKGLLAASYNILFSLKSKE